MLRLIAYDITCPKRLHRVADLCEQFGVRVQKSLFECWLDEDRFGDLWQRLQLLVDPETDQIVAYVLDNKAAKRRRTYGERMTVTEKRSWCVF